VSSVEGRELAAGLARLSEQRNAILDEVSRAVVGQEQVLELMIAALLAQGHCLLVGVPGLAKTQMAKALAGSLDLSFRRIQFTPDLMPSDITGTNVIYDLPEGGREFRFVQGPVFANIVLADEINRTPPKTQAAMLEAMQERQVSVAQKTYELEPPFFVIATQNPIEQEGTYELPEAQLDRFMFDIHVEYPPLAQEEQILSSTTAQQEVEGTRPILSVGDVLEAQRLVRRVAVSNYMVSYVARIIRSTRPSDELAPAFVKEFVEWGVGPRGGQLLILGAKALAAIGGRPNVSVADIHRAAVPALRHRVATNFQAQAEGIGSVDIVRRLLKSIPEPKVPRYG
jgi:MoxR-like ATPase